VTTTTRLLLLGTACGFAIGFGLASLAWSHAHPLDRDVPR
jgi:hypothetical protein